MSDRADNQSMWQTTPLSEELQRLCDLYVHYQLPVDQLPYTEEFKELVRDAGLEVNDANMRDVFRKLLFLRKQGRLPRAYSRAT